MTRWSIAVVAGGIVVSAIAAVTTFGAATACNSGNGDCPEKPMVMAGAACSDDHLQCAYDLSTPAAACDGTMTIIETSCTCTNGQWSCPSAFDCDSGVVEADASTDAGVGDEADAGDTRD